MKLFHKGHSHPLIGNLVQPVNQQEHPLPRLRVLRKGAERDLKLAHLRPERDGSNHFADTLHRVPMQVPAPEIDGEPVLVRQSVLHLSPPFRVRVGEGNAPDERGLAAAGFCQYRGAGGFRENVADFRLFPK